MSKQNVRGFKALVTRIEKSNEKFAKATQDQRILMVAKDVLSLLDLERIKAQWGRYFSMDTSKLPEKMTSKKCEVSKLLKMPELPACNVCAIGGAMMASTLRLNKVKVDASYCVEEVYNEGETGTMSERAEDVFPAEMLKCMEDAFEGGDFGYARLVKVETRLRAIYQNLVDNKGKCFTHYRSQRVVYPYPEGTETIEHRIS